MAEKSWILTDVEKDVFVENLTLGPVEAGGAARGYSIVKRTLHGGLREGVDVIEVHNGRLRFVVVPTRGMNLWRASLGDLQLGWSSAVRGPVHPKFVNLAAPDGVGWLDGFDELLCRCGLVYVGGPDFNQKGVLRYSMHGKISNTPAHRVEVAVDGDAGTITVRGIVDEARTFGNKLRLSTAITTQIGSPELTITDVVSNVWEMPSDFRLLYHINLGVPLLNPGSKVFMPVRKVEPRVAGEGGDIAEWNLYGPGTPDFANVVLLTEHLADSAGRSLAVLQNAAANQGIAVKYNTKQLPSFTLWKSLLPASDGYVTGLEPGTHPPAPGSVDHPRGRVTVLAPGQSHTSVVTLEALPDAESVARAVRSVAEIQGSTAVEVSPNPPPQWPG
jgi:hypothetical protein